MTLENCVDSVLRTGYAPLEIIIVDDCSTDKSFSIAQELEKSNPGTVKVIQQAVNGGPALARNAGARIADGEYYFFLDSDTEMLPDALYCFAERMKDPEIDAVIGIYDSQPLNDGAAPLYKALLNNYFFLRKGVIEYEVFDSARAGIRSNVFDDLGGFNESLKWGMDYENEELGYRIIEKYNMVLDPSIAVKHVFPCWKKLTTTYFLRVALWMQVFLSRKKFESGGVTSAGTGVSSAAILASLFFFLFAFLPTPYRDVSYVLAAISFAVYVYGYLGFFAFTAARNPAFLLVAVLLNIYFTIIIAAGASFGLLRHVFGKQLSFRS